MATLNPYLNYQGNTEEAFNFYKSVFGDEFSSLVRFKDMPVSADSMPGGNKLAPEETTKIMHVALPIGGNTLMATDMLESQGHKLKLGNNITLSLEAESKEEADKLFNGLSAGGKIGAPIADAPWGAYWGMLTDKFDVPWMVNYTYPKK
jgi:PhnB protein